MWVAIVVHTVVVGFYFWTHSTCDRRVVLRGDVVAGVMQAVRGARPTITMPAWARMCIMIPLRGRGIRIICVVIVCAIAAAPWSLAWHMCETGIVCVLVCVCGFVSCMLLFLSSHLNHHFCGVVVVRCVCREVHSTTMAVR